MKAAVVILVLISAGLYGWLAWADSDPPPIGRFLILSQLLAASYFGLLFLLKRNESISRNRSMVLFLVIAGLVIRVLTVTGAGQTSYLSDDVYRYIWEGKLVVEGHNPYITSPEQMSDTPLADSTIFPKINNKHLPTIYPPLSQAFFVVAYLIGGDSLTGFKLISFLFELLTALAMLLLVRRFKLPAWTFWIYYFSPLVIIEFLFSNHHDILAMPFLVLTLFFLHSRKAAAAGLMLALATMVKLFGLFFVPIALVHLKGTDRYRFLAVFGVCCALCYLPFIAEAGSDLFGSLWHYLGNWRFNGSTYWPLSQLIGSVPARLFSGATFAAISLAALRYPRDGWDPFRAMFITFGAYIILSPSMFSWYLVWIIPFLVIYRSLPFLVLTGTIFLSYQVLTGLFSRGVWSESAPYTIATYLPFYGLLLYQLVNRKQRAN